MDGEEFEASLAEDANGFGRLRTPRGMLKVPSTSFAAKSRFDRTMQESTRDGLKTARLKVEEHIDAGETGTAEAGKGELAGYGKHSRLRQAAWNGSRLGESRAALLPETNRTWRQIENGFGHGRGSVKRGNHEGRGPETVSAVGEEPVK